MTACLAGVGLFIGGLMAGAAHADDANPLWDDGNRHLTWNGEIGAGGFGVPNANFGAGSYSAGPPASGHQSSPAWGEAYARLQFDLTDVSDLGTFYARLSAIYARTVGSGDAELTTAMRGDPGHLGPEEAAVGWRSVIDAPEPLALDLEIGRQDLVIDDGFLIANGAANAGYRADYYLTPRNAFDGFGVLHLNGSPVRADLFVLENATSPGLARHGLDAPYAKFYGADVTWFSTVDRAGADGAVNYADRQSYATLTLLHIFDSMADGRPTSRDGMTVASLSTGGSPLPDLPAFSLYGQIVSEQDSDPGRKLDALAYYIEPGWAFVDWPLQPTIAYRYSHYSGARSATETTSHLYDPLFAGAGYRNNFGSCIGSEIIGNYIVSDSNDNVQQVDATITLPYHYLTDDDSLKIDLLYYIYTYDHPASVGATSAAIGTELDFAGEYQYSAGVRLSAAFGVAWPGSGAASSIAAQRVADGLQSQEFRQTTGLLEFYAIIDF